MWLQVLNHTVLKGAGQLLCSLLSAGCFVKLHELMHLEQPSLCEPMQQSAQPQERPICGREEAGRPWGTSSAQRNPLCPWGVTQSPVTLQGRRRHLHFMTPLPAAGKGVKVTGDSLYGFTKDQSPLTNLIAFYHKATGFVGKRRAVEVICLDFQHHLPQYSCI